MRLSDRFLNLLHQQLRSFETDAEIKGLIVYIAQAQDKDSPALEAIGHWPERNNSLPPVELDPELRAPSIDRRWYPIQEEAILLGVLRAERFPSTESWPEALDKKLKLTAKILGQYLGLELDRTRLQEELIQQKQEISFMVHQLRNPLAALRTYAQLLLKKIGPEAKDRVLVENMLSEQEQLNKYISALDKVGKNNLTLKDTSPAPLLLPPVLNQNESVNIKKLLEPLIERASAKANLQGREWIAPLNWPFWTEQSTSFNYGIVAEIVANVLENAFNYSIPSSPIGICIEDKSICIWDGGESIKKEERKKIFKKGFRGFNSFSHKGSGLGLALAKELAEQLGGELNLIIPPREFNQELPEIGNAFVLTLPIK